MVAERIYTKSRGVHPHKFTLWVAIASILMMFAGLTSAYVVKSNLAGWTTIAVPRVFWYSTIVIVLSSITLWLAEKSFTARNMTRYRVLIAVTLCLGVLFVVLQWLGFENLWYTQHISFKGVAGAGQFLYIIFGLHALHVIGGIVVLCVLFFRAFFGPVKVYSPVPLQVASTYWHFVDALWIYLFIFFLLIM